MTVLTVGDSKCSWPASRCFRPFRAGPFPAATTCSRIIRILGSGLRVFPTKKRKLQRVPVGRRSMACECGTCDRPRRKGLKGEDDGSPQHYLGVSSARSRCRHRARAGGPTACPEHGSAVGACPWQGQGTPRLRRNRPSLRAISSLVVPGCLAPGRHQPCPQGPALASPTGGEKSRAIDPRGRKTADLAAKSSAKSHKIRQRSKFSF